MKFTLFSAVLFSIGWMSVVAEGDPPSCCLSVTDTRIPFENIVKYDMQDPPLCRIRAVRFYTNRSIVICSDPESKNAKRAMDIVDGRTTTTPTICYTSTTNTIPAVTIPNKRPGTKTETFTVDGPPTNCCLSVTNTKPPFENIVKYDMQDPPVCGIRAVRFYTKKNKVVCSDPESKYAKRAMYIVDGRKTTTPTICYTSTTNTIPAVTRTNKTPGKKTETFTSTTATRIVTTIETSRPETETSTSDVRPVDCCYSLTDIKPPVENIVKYDMQDPALCGIRAVRFYTKKNKVVCSDPKSNYAKRAMDIVDGRKTTTPRYTSTTNTIPAVTTTNKTPGKKTETFTSTTATRIVTTIETSRPETEASTVQDWVQDSIQRLNKRKTTEKTDQIDFDNTYFCLKKEQAEYFCIKQP